jgi:uncharacterized surface protein with fasciclin (FAS1) repeats
MTANLTQDVGSLKDITIFAPNNDAFAAIGSLAATLSMTDLTNILKYHVVDSVAYSTDLTNTTLKAADGTELKITVANGTVFVNSAKVVEADLLVSNGVVHVLDQ